MDETTNNIALPKWLFSLGLVIMISLCGGLVGVYQSQLNSLEAKLETHRESAGHPVAMARVYALEEAVRKLAEADAKLLETLQTITKNQVRICSKLRAAGCEQ